MKIDAAKLETAIDNMKSVCADGKADIKRLFSEAFDVEFETDGDFDVKVGDRVEHVNWGDQYIVAQVTKHKINLININTGDHFNGFTEGYIGHNYKISTLIGSNDCKLFVKIESKK